MLHLINLTQQKYPISYVDIKISFYRVTHSSPDDIC